MLVYEFSMDTLPGPDMITQCGPYLRCIYRLQSPVEKELAARGILK